MPRRGETGGTLRLYSGTAASQGGCGYAEQRRPANFVEFIGERRGGRALA